MLAVAFRNLARNNLVWHSVPMLIGHGGLVISLQDDLPTIINAKSSESGMN